MTQKPYFRDIWALGPSSNGYPGAFPNGLIEMIRRKWWGTKRLMLFAGSFHDGGWDTVDIKPELKPTFVADCSSLTFIPDASYDMVMADPPYSEAEALELYGLPYVSMVAVLNEMARICKPGGYCLLLHRLIPAIHPGFNQEFKQLKIIGIVGVFTIAGFSNIRALTVWQKMGTLKGVF